MDKFKLPYEISWLKNLWLRKVSPRIKWHFRRRNLYGRNLTYKQYYGDLIKNWSRIMISLPFIITFLGCITFLVGSSLMMMYKFVDFGLLNVLKLLK